MPFSATRLVLLALLPTCVETTAQDSWQEVRNDPIFSGSSLAAIVYDAARNRTVAHGILDGVTGAAQTAEWDGSQWERVATASAGPLPLLNNQVMEFDAARRRMVLVGDAAGQMETWEWDGLVWQQRATSGPSPRRYTDVAYDSLRRRLVLHGGYTGLPTPLNDTWEWDGTTWAQVSSAGPAVYDAALAFDPVRGRTVLHGGSDNGVAGTYFPNLATWEWDGSAWTQVHGSGPVARFGEMTFHAGFGRCILTAETPQTPSSVDTWQWDGITWQRLPVPAVAPVSIHRSLYDAWRNEVRIHEIGRRVWAFDGSTWRQEGYPLADRAAFAYDTTRNRALLYAPFRRELWSWDGRDWTLLDNAGPQAKNGYALAFDVARGRLVMQGAPGRAGSCETWEWDGTSWAAAFATGPNVLAMVYDAARAHVVAVSKSSASLRTYTWDGTLWTLATSVGPSSRSSTAMAYDSRRGRVVLFDGQLSGDTWEWDGTAWTQIPAAAPPPRLDHAMAFDAARQRVVVFGGTGTGVGFATLDDLWEWDGMTWAQRSIAPGPLSRRYAATVYDPDRNRLVVYAGIHRSQSLGIKNLADLWEVSPLADLGAMARICTGHAGRPTLRAPSTLPRPGTTFVAEVSGLPAGTPVLGLLAIRELRPPAPLGGIGMPGCALHLDIVGIQPLAPSAGRAAWSLPLPRALGSGVRILLQAIVADPGANAAGATVTNGAAFVTAP